MITSYPSPLDLHMSQTATNNTYELAKLIMTLVDNILKIFDLQNNENLFLATYFSLIFCISILIGIVTKWIIIKILHAIKKHIQSEYYNTLINHKFFTRICRIVPPIVFIIFIQFTMSVNESISLWLSRLSWIYIIIIICNSLNVLSEALWEQINLRANKRKLPLNGVVQLFKMIIWIIGIVIMSAVLLNKSPASLLAGLGAFAAVLMLIFKDSILGVVAGVQLAENDSLHIGDWIVPNNSSANGIVVNVGLTAIMIENWDKTISTIPPYNLVSQGFRNYRNMQLSNTREIKRSYMIDADSVISTTDSMLTEFKKIPLIANWITKKIEQKENGKSEDVNNSEGLVDGSIDSNLGIFRAYLKLWLDTNSNIDHNSDCFISTLAQTHSGIPLQVYCFTSTSAWIAYEAIQSSVFEHIAVMLHKFNLYIFEDPSGRDTIIDGYLSNGFKNIGSIYGIPQPFFSNSEVDPSNNSDRTNKINNSGEN